MLDRRAGGTPAEENRAQRDERRIHPHRAGRRLHFHRSRRNRAL